MAQLAVRVAPDDAPIVAVTCFPLKITRIGQWRLPLVAYAPADIAAMMAEGIRRLPAPPHLRLVPRPEVFEQLVLPLEKARRRSRRSAAFVTPVMEMVEATVRRHAAAALPMPNNPTLGEMSGGRGRNTVWKALKRLVAIGRILIEVDGLKRRVWVRDTGQVTGWGDHYLRSAPYSVHTKGEKAQERARRPDLSADLEGEPERLRVEPMKLVEADAADLCCWPMWGDGEQPTHIYCDEPVAPYLQRRGVSYCEQHAPPRYLRR